MDEVVDGHELNFSCPHAEGHGTAIGTDLKLVYGITRAVCQATDKPVFVKLTPNTSNLAEIARAAVDAGAHGLVAINTVGPGYYSHDRHPILTNKVGGMSGRGILPIGLKSVREIRQAVGPDVPIIGMGGIRTARDIEDYDSVGANVFGIGSALAGMVDEQILTYLNRIVTDLGNRTSDAEQLLQEVDMGLKRVKIERKIDVCEDFKIFETGIGINAGPGQFVFAWLPNVGEKPLSVMDNNPLTLAVQEKGEFTRSFNQLGRGDDFYFRGPYGKEVSLDINKEMIVVGGGCGIAGVYLFAKRFKQMCSFSNVTAFLGAKDKEHLAYFQRLKDYGNVYFATEDGSLGLRGTVADLFSNVRLDEGSMFFNCGPKAMVEALLPIERQVSSADRIYSSLDYITSCGVGLCGKCVDEKGRRTCVYGPFMPAT